ncbi:MAG TPA: Lrp/AsnC family transcriptional regulator [bacterium]|nr:Lrp/AsnC family transcriptional regulator [bacterium]
MVFEKLKLDKIDRKIISMLQENPKIPHSEIAVKIKRSQPTVGIRIKNLTEKGILQFQAGINFKNVALYLAIVKIISRNPRDIINMARSCPFMLNAFHLSGDNDVLVFLASSKLEKLYNIVEYHFRNNPEVIKVSMEVVTEIAKDFILPIDLEIENLNPTSKKGCGVKCTYEFNGAKIDGLLQ